MFGGNNIELLDIQIRVLQEKMNSDEIWDTFSNPDDEDGSYHLVSAALEAYN
jgi:hypothetical protein